MSGIEEKVIALDERGMSTQDIEEQIQEIYGISLSANIIEGLNRQYRKATKAKTMFP